MKGSTKRFFSMILSAILLVCAVVVYSTFVLPEYERVSSLRGEYQGKQATLDQQRQIVNKVNALLTQYRSIPDLANVLSLLLPTQEDVASIFQQIYAISRDSGMGIQQFGVNTSLAVQPVNLSSDIIKSIGTVQVNLNLVGPYAAAKRMLSLLERNIRIMDVQSLKIQPVGQSSQDLYFVNLVINSYYQTE